MSRDFFMVPWIDPFQSTSMFPSRRFSPAVGTRGHLANMESLWSEAMKEMQRMQDLLDSRVGVDLAPWHSSIESHVEAPTNEGGPGKYLMNIPLGLNVKPEDLKISMKEENGSKIMTVDAKKEQKTENSRVYQEWTRKFTLPKDLDMKQVKSYLHNGVLKVEAPLPQAAIKEEEKTAKPIPIQMAKVG